VIVELLLFFMDCRACEVYEQNFQRTDRFWACKRWLEFRDIQPLMMN
jgi:hypothetical protein